MSRPDRCHTGSVDEVHFTTTSLTFQLEMNFSQGPNHIGGPSSAGERLRGSRVKSSASPDPAPAVRADGSVNRLAGARRDEQAAIGAILVTIGRISVTHRALRHLCRLCRTNAQTEDRGHAERGAEDVSARRFCCFQLFEHALSPLKLAKTYLAAQKKLCRARGDYHCRRR